MTVRLRPSPRELRSILLYLIDWIFVGGIALVAFAFGRLTPNLRPFSIDDPNISYPYQTNAKIPTWLLSIISTVIPGVLIALTIFILPKHRVQKLKTRIWVLNTSWLGLGVALATAMLVTDGLKNLVGKPRPDLLSRCAPDPERLVNDSFRVGTRFRYLFTVQICTSWDSVTEAGLGKSKLLDGFRSWVSGHASISFAGLTYLTIFLSFHLLKPWSQGPIQNTQSSQRHRKTSHPSAPLLLLISVPVLLAIYVAATRYSDFRHHGVDVVFGSLLGIGAAFLGWTCYGSRSIRGARGFGGLFRKTDNCNCNNDMELGVILPGEETVHRADSGVATGGDDQIVTEGEFMEGRGQLGEAVEGESKGALQLREMSLSISTLDRAEDGIRGKSTEVPSQDNNSNSPEVRHSSTSYEGAPAGTESKLNMI